MPATQTVWTRSRVIAALDNDTHPDFVDRALKSLFERQTFAEQRAETTKVQNDQGFTASDATTLTRIAKQAAKYGGTLTPRQRALCRIRLRKYWRQFLEVTAANGKPVSYNPKH